MLEASLPAVAPGAPTVDARAARLSQASVALLVVLAAALRAPALLIVPALHLASSAARGARWNLVLRGFAAWVRPRLASSAPEDARPLRFANTIGAVFLAAALLAHASGLAVAGWALAGIVAALAFLAAATGFCVGCRLYWLVSLGRRFRGV